MKQKKSQLSLLFALTSSVFGLSIADDVHAEDTVVDVQPEVVFVEADDVVAEPVEAIDVLEVTEIETVVDEPIKHEVIDIISPTSESKDQSFDKDKADTNQQNAPPVDAGNVVDLEEKERYLNDAINAFRTGNARLLTREEFNLRAASVGGFASSVYLRQGARYGYVHYSRRTNNKKDKFPYHDQIHIQLMDGQWVYCVEPYTSWDSTYDPYTPEIFDAGDRVVNRKEYKYDHTEYPITYTTYQIRRLEKIVAFADSTPIYGSLAKDVRRYAFTQALIWDDLGYDIDTEQDYPASSVKDFNPNDLKRKGDADAFLQFRSEVFNKVYESEHRSTISYERRDGGKPSFNDEHHTLAVGESITLTDRNNVLEHLEFDTYKDGFRFSKVGNRLTITATDQASEDSFTELFMTGSDVSTSRRGGSTRDIPSVLFRQTGKQSFARLHYNEPPTEVRTVINYSGEVSVSLKPKPKPVLGELTLQKVDDTGEAVPGVRFVIEGPSGFRKSLEVDDEGILILSDLELGTYTITETNAPAGYIKSSAKRVTISKAQPQVTERIVNNRQKGKIVIQKEKSSLMGELDIEGNPEYSLAGAVFAIYKNNDEIGRIRTDAQGRGESALLELGEYTLREITAPKGFIKVPIVYNVTVRGNVKNTPVVVTERTIYNEPVGGHIIIKKTDSETGGVLNNVAFDIYNERNQVVDTITTNASGIARTKRLPLGTYYAVEKEAPQGYRLNTTRHRAVLEMGNPDRVRTTVESSLTVENMRIPSEPPTIRTYAYNLKDKTKYILSTESVFIMDDVYYANLEIGGNYRLETTLMSKTTRRAFLDANQRELTKVTEFRPDAATGKLTVGFDADTRDPLRDSGRERPDEDLVVFQKLYKDGRLVATHEDYDNEDQSVYLKVLKITTEAAFVGGSSDRPRVVEREYTESSDTELIDTVTYRGLVPGRRYSLISKLMNPETREVHRFGRSESEIETTTYFIANDSNGTVDTKLTLPAGFLNTSSADEINRLVVFQYLYDEDFSSSAPIASHEDYDDEKQSIRFVTPTIVTTATNKADGSKLIIRDLNEFTGRGGLVTIKDTVRYTNLIPGATYTLVGKLMSKDTNKTLVTSVAGLSSSMLHFLGTPDDRLTDEVIVEKTFEATSENGSIDMDFEFYINNLNTQSIVVFQRLMRDDRVVATHEDIDNEDQTVKLVASSMTTEARSADNQTKLIQAVGNVTVRDTVQYKDLIPGREYILDGKLVLQEDGSSVRGSNGDIVNKTLTFRPDTPNGSVSLDFKFDGRDYIGKKIVVFERIVDRTSGRNVIVAMHEDLNDPKQTVDVVEPRVVTNAYEKVTYGKEVLPYSDTTIVDVISYTNLKQGETYTINGKLMDRDTRQPLLIDGREVTVTKTFVAGDIRGSESVEYSFDATKVAGKTIVVYETLSHGGKVIARHEDIDDAAQRISFLNPSLITTATVYDQKETFPASRVIIKDVIEYNDVIANEAYRIEGKLYDVDEHAPLLVNGREVTSVITFTPNASRGYETMLFQFDASGLNGKKIVVLGNNFPIINILINLC